MSQQDNQIPTGTDQIEEKTEPSQSQDKEVERKLDKATVSKVVRNALNSMRGHNFILTLNNPQTHYKDLDWKEYLEKWHTEGKADFVTGQLEKGKDGTPHIQFFLHYKAQKRIAALKKHCKHAHIETCKRAKDSLDYCRKEDSRVEGPYTKGQEPFNPSNKEDWDNIWKAAKEGRFDDIPA